VPPSILGRFAILCAILRQFHLILQISVLSSELAELRPTVFLVDQLSAGIPLLRSVQPAVQILFYCHFPDKLLAKPGGLLKTLYRWPFDALESWSTGCSDGIVVNSNFTKGVFRDVFPALKDRKPRVIYPCVDTEGKSEAGKDPKPLWNGKGPFLSINRFERKKDVGLAIRAYAGLTDAQKRKSRLVIAGGYDLRVAENVQYHQELRALAEQLNLKHATAKTVPTALAIPNDIDVLFLLSVPNTFKAMLLSSAKILIYTPLNEHFGIVPLEAMLAGTPVLAADQGGPTETVVDGKTGWLRDVTEVRDWADVMRAVVDGTCSEKRLQEMGDHGKERVKALFSKERMATRFEEEINRLMTLETRLSTGQAIVPAFIAATIAIAISTWLMLGR
jgi:alpha-1,3/alpha-1,6-mannosyltransferase